MIAPKFKHDCDGCRFLGRLDGRDCYVHEHPNHTSFLLRYGDEDSEYLAWPSELEDQVLVIQILKRMMIP